MCGIAGIVAHGAGVEGAWIAAMNDAMRHRGPDDEGYLALAADGTECRQLSGRESAVAHPPIAAFHGPADLLLGHRRLSIIDLSTAARQPMASPDGNCWCVYNGEIYNYRELREELRAAGHVFRTDADTEVLLAAYAMWGEECLHRFNGMWAFAIADRRRKRLFCARDRFGVKPFYYLSAPPFFAFASEIKALLTLPFAQRRINRAAAFDYLVTGLEENGAETLFAGIFELPPAHTLTYDLAAHRMKIERYYRLPVEREWRSFDERRASAEAEETRTLIVDAVRRRLRSDVPVGSCLSGGLDSSAVVCVAGDLLAREHPPALGDRQKVFTARYRDPAIDEGPWAEIVAKRKEIAWHQVEPDAERFAADLDDLVRTQDLPFCSTSIYAQYCVMNLAKKSGVKVLLDGQGGDELFAGYALYYPPFFAEMARGLRLPALAAEFAHLDNGPIDRTALARQWLALLATKFLPTPIAAAAYGCRAGVDRYLHPDFLREQAHRLDTLAEHRHLSLNDALAAAMTRRGLRSLLRYEDRNAMRFSIEARTPFADDLLLIERMFALPSADKIRRGWSKVLLRKAMKGVVPPEILARRDKVGFATPERAWLTAMREPLRDTVADREAVAADDSAILRRETILDDWDAILRDPSPDRLARLWRTINFALWKRAFRL